MIIHPVGKVSDNRPLRLIAVRKAVNSNCADITSSSESCLMVPYLLFRLSRFELRVQCVWRWFWIYVTGDHYRIGQSSVSHSLKNNVGVLTKFSRYKACNVELLDTKKLCRWLASISFNLRKCLTLAFKVFADSSKNIRIKYLACQTLFWHNEMFRSTL